MQVPYYISPWSATSRTSKEAYQLPTGCRDAKHESQNCFWYYKQMKFKLFFGMMEFGMLSYEYLSTLEIHTFHLL